MKYRVMAALLAAALIEWLAASSSSAGIPQEFAYDSKGKRDPMIPISEIPDQGQKKDTGAEYRLEGVILDPQGSIAMINGKIYKEGETLGNYKVSKIEPNSVILVKDQDRLQLSLKGLTKRREEKK